MDVVGREVPGEAGAGLGQVDADDAAGSVRLGDGLAQHADGAAAEDEDGLPAAQVGRLADLHRYGDGLDEGAVFHGHVVRDGVGVVARHDVVLLERCARVSAASWP